MGRLLFVGLLLAMGRSGLAAMKSEYIFRVLIIAVMVLSGVLSWRTSLWWCLLGIASAALLSHSLLSLRGGLAGLRTDWDYLRVDALSRGWIRARRIARTLLGGVLLLAGGIMVFLPGPGALVIFLGLGILATEYAWARRWMVRLQGWLDRVRRKTKAPPVVQPRLGDSEAPTRSPSDVP